MIYPAKAVANYFIRQAVAKKDERLNPMKLLKLIYIAHGWTLAIFEQPLIQEPVEAWRYGPVIPAVYHAVKHFGMHPITEIIKNVDVNDEGRIFTNTYPIEFEPNDKIQLLLDRVIVIHQHHTGVQLSNWTHESGSPWDQVWNLDRGQIRDFCLIDNDIIKKYFSKLGGNCGSSHTP